MIGIEITDDDEKIEETTREIDEREEKGKREEGKKDDRDERGFIGVEIDSDEGEEEESDEGEDEGEEEGEKGEEKGAKEEKGKKGDKKEKAEGKRETRKAERTQDEEEERAVGESWFRDLMLGHIRMPFDPSWKFVIFIVFIFFVYITNHIEMESRMRRISDLTRAIKELKYEHITTQSELMNMSRQSEVLRRAEAENLGLHELTEPPRIVER
ncbi:MAG: hypothetical protein II951_09960 [Bacteroidales bacterium]|nr:hypothetical protein [Bacteroidales bacterium]